MSDQAIVDGDGQIWVGDKIIGRWEIAEDAPRLVAAWCKDAGVDPKTVTIIPNG